jgi:hypothetical protein
MHVCAVVVLRLWGIVCTVDRCVSHPPLAALTAPASQAVPSKAVITSSRCASISLLHATAVELTPGCLPGASVLG